MPLHWPNKQAVLQVCDEPLARHTEWLPAQWWASSTLVHDGVLVLPSGSSQLGVDSIGKQGTNPDHDQGLASLSTTLIPNSINYYSF